MNDDIGIRFAPELFGPVGPKTDAHDETVRVVSAAPDKAAAALAAASRRFMLVVHDGRELADIDEVDAYVVAADDPSGAIRHYNPHNPSIVDPVLDVNGHPGTSIELKTYIPEPMADRFRTILTEELSRAGVDEARVEPFSLTCGLPEWTFSS